MKIIDRIFKLSEHKTNVRTELLAGLTTFLTMAYILFVNPAILGDAGMPKDAVFMATIFAAIIGTLIMAFYANYPIVIAPGMGLNAFFAYTVVHQMGYSWQVALGAVFISGVCFLVITLTGLREIIVKGIPQSLRIAITAGIGLFLAIIALKSSGIVVANPATLVTLGDLHSHTVLLSIFGFFLIVALDHLKIKGAVLIGILVVTVLSFFVGGNQFHGIFATPPSIEPTWFQLDIKGALSIGILNVVLVFFLVELFDATGTLMAVAKRAGLLTEKHMPRLSKALLADSVAITAGSILGTSSSTAYIESAAGVQAGGRTGLTAVTIAVLFLACLFISPLAGTVPAYATAPALLFVACLMQREMTEIQWDDTTEVIPAVLTTLGMPLTYSIANGVAFGFISYVLLKTLTGQAKSVKPIVWIIAALFVVRYAFLIGE